VDSRLTQDSGWVGSSGHLGEGVVGGFSVNAWRDGKTPIISIKNLTTKIIFTLKNSSEGKGNPITSYSFGNVNTKTQCLRGFRWKKPHHLTKLKFHLQKKGEIKKSEREYRIVSEFKYRYEKSIESKVSIFHFIFPSLR
jgi:hypothetical protein